MKINLEPYLKLLRIKDWRSLVVMPSIGLIVTKGYLFPLKDIVVFYTILLLLLGFGFSVNDCFDTKEDKYAKDKKNPIARGEISFRKGLSFSLLLGILALGLSTYFGFKIFLFCLAGALIGFFYSAPPLRMKSRPVIDLISHGFFGGVFLVVLPMLIFKSQLTLFHYLIIFSFFYISITSELRNHLEDYESDMKAGLKTSVCVFGYERSERALRYLLFFYPLVLFSIFLLLPQKYFLVFLISTLIFLFLLLFRRNLKAVKDYRVFDAYLVVSFGLILAAFIF